MSDDERKRKKADEAEDEAHDEAEDEADDEDNESEEAAASEEDDEQPAAEDAGDDEEEPDAEAAAPGVEQGGAATRVAQALGVVEKPGDGEEGAEDEEAPVLNRAARRAEAAQRRKKRKEAAAPKIAAADADADPDGGADPDDPLPKDKNARAKELLRRRREQAATARPVQLLPGEMVDDALARSASATSKWLRQNFGVIQWVIVAAVLGGAGYLVYDWQMEKRAGAATSALSAGLLADRGRVAPEDKRSDEEKEADPLKVYKTVDERADTALASYRKVESEHPGTGAAILARLGEGGDLLDKHVWEHALEAYSAVSSSTLAGADTDVKARALEGIGFAKEGKGDTEGAIAAFKELAGLAGFKELGQYHEARILLAKGDKDKAKDLLKQVREALEKPSEVHQNHYLQQVTDDALRRIDPALVPAKAPIGGGAKGGAMTQEELQAAMKKLKENMAKGEREKAHHEEHKE